MWKTLVLAYGLLLLLCLNKHVAGETCDSEACQKLASVRAVFALSTDHDMDAYLRPRTDAEIRALQFIDTVLSLEELKIMAKTQEMISRRATPLGVPCAEATTTQDTLVSTNLWLLPILLVLLFLSVLYIVSKQARVKAPSRFAAGIK